MTQSLGRAILPAARYDALSFVVRRMRGRRDPGRHALIDRAFVEVHGATVRAGPFTGMSYEPVFVGHTTAVAAKLLGAYELELHAAINRLLATDMSLFVDVGCAEGYYAAGVALRRPDVRVVAFDVDPAARRMCRMLAQRNQVSVEVRSEATTDYLSSLGPGAVVFSDCEGAESHLLDPERAPALVHLPIVVEIHDFVDSGISSLLRRRFEGSHHVQEVVMRPRDPVVYPELQCFVHGERELALSEGRPATMSWYVMEPK